MNYGEKYHQVYQYVYSLLFLKYFILIQECGVNIRVLFILHFNEWLDKNIKMIIIATIIKLKNLLKISKIKTREKFMGLGGDQLRKLKILLLKQKNRPNILLLLKRKAIVLSNILKGKYGVDKKYQRGMRKKSHWVDWMQLVKKLTLITD